MTICALDAALWTVGSGGRRDVATAAFAALSLIVLYTVTLVL